MHHPDDDVIDRRTGGQFFLHSHDADTHGFAHFHCFVRLPGKPFGVARARVTTHVAAIAVDEAGWPVRLVATNQWVTGELWQPARRTLALLDRFTFGSPNLELGEVGVFLRAVLEMHWPELNAILLQRDARLRARQARHPAGNVLQDQRIEVVASRAIDLRRRLRQLSR